MTYVNAWLLRVLSIPAGALLAFVPAAFARKVFLNWQHGIEQEDPLFAAFMCLAIATVLQFGTMLAGWSFASDIESEVRR